MYKSALLLIDLFNGRRPIKEIYEEENTINLKRILRENGVIAINYIIENFKDDNEFWLSKDALYEALVIENNNDYWPLWESSIDRNLFNPKTEEDVTYTVESFDAKEEYRILADSVDDESVELLLKAEQLKTLKRKINIFIC